MGACASRPQAVEEAAAAPTLVVWDIENVRAPFAPDAGMTTLDALGHVRSRLVAGAGFDELRAVCCVTPASLRAMHAQSPRWLDGVVPELMVLVASCQHQKRGADYVLKREMARFVHDEALKRVEKRGSQRARVVLLTGDCDFLEPVQSALRLGIDVQLVYYHGNVSPALLRLPYRSAPVEWAAFLAACNGGVEPVLPYSLPSTQRPKHDRPPARRHSSKQTQTDSVELFDLVNLGGLLGPDVTCPAPLAAEWRGVDEDGEPRPGRWHDFGVLKLDLMRPAALLHGVGG